MSDLHTRSWNPALKSLHWALFVVIAAAVICVATASGYERGDPMKGQLMFFHKSLGITAFALMVAWVLTRRAKGRPEKYGRAWQVRLSGLVHWAMVLLILALPVAGLLMAQFAQQPVSFFGLFTIPVWLAENKPLAKSIHTLHAGFAGPLLVGLVALHLVGALWHHVIDRDRTLARMLPGRGSD